MQTKQQWTVAVALTLGSLFVGCGRNAQEAAAGDSSAPAFILWGVSDGCLVRKINKPKITMCVTGSGDLERSKTMTRKALLTWIEPLRGQSEGATLATEVEFGCSGTQDGSVNLQPGDGTAMAGPGNVNIFDQSAFGTYLHEFGHAFACIGDTYVGGMAANCMQGQPHSIMCDGLLRNDLSEDDVTAVRRQYATANGINPGVPAGDEDGDGVDNAKDRCAATPTGSTVWHEEEGGKWRGCASGQTPLS
jgi:hypothetical protein